MQDGRTRRVELPGQGADLGTFLARFRAALVVLSGGAAGSEHPLESERLVLGRGPGVELAFDDSAMSRRHAVLEVAKSGFRVRDLGSTNGVFVNGGRVQAADLKHGDRVQLGGHVFQYVVEEQASPPPTYTLPER